MLELFSFCSVFLGGDKMILNVISFGYEVEDVGFYIYYFGIMGFLICVNILGNIFVMMIILCYWDLYINSNYLLVN